MIFEKRFDVERPRSWASPENCGLQYNYDTVADEHELWIWDGDGEGYFYDEDAAGLLKVLEAFQDVTPDRCSNCGHSSQARPVDLAELRSWLKKCGGAA